MNAKNSELKLSKKHQLKLVALPGSDYAGRNRDSHAIMAMADSRKL